MTRIALSAALSAALLALAAAACTAESYAERAVRRDPGLGLLLRRGGPAAGREAGSPLLARGRGIRGRQPAVPVARHAEPRATAPARRRLRRDARAPDPGRAQPRVRAARVRAL